MEPKVEIAGGARHKARREQRLRERDMAVRVKPGSQGVGIVSEGHVLPAVVGNHARIQGDYVGLEVGVPDISPERAGWAIGARKTGEPELDPLRKWVGGIVPFHQR